MCEIFNFHTRVKCDLCACRCGVFLFAIMCKIVCDVCAGIATGVCFQKNVKMSANVCDMCVGIVSEVCL